MDELTNDALIIMDEAVKKYVMGGETIYALNHVSLQIKRGEYVSIVGPSGSGKSTLMNIIGCLDIADEGRYVFCGKPIEKFSQRQLARIRSREIGFIFQGFNLLPKLSALENVELPMIYQNVPAAERRERAMEALTRVGLAERVRHKPTQLSGGQQQRAAVARALAGRPSLILADEPTGNLDKKTGLEIMALLEALHAEGNTIVLITHDPKIAARAQRTLRIEDGRIQHEGAAEDALAESAAAIDVPALSAKEA